MNDLRRLGLVLVGLLAASPGYAGLVAYYDFDQTLADSSGSGYDLTMGQAATYDSTFKIAGDSIRIDFQEGLNLDYHPYRTLNNMPALLTTQARQHMTVTVWFRSTDQFASWRSVLGTSTASATDPIFYMSQMSSTGRGWIDVVDSNGVAVGSSSAYADNPPAETEFDWQFLAFTWDGQDALPFPGRTRVFTGRLGGPLYQYGTEWTSGLMRAPINPALNYFSLGGQYTGDTYTNGYFDELAVWDETLTPGQIAELFARGSQGATIPEPASAVALVAGLMTVLRRRR